MLCGSVVFDRFCSYYYFFLVARAVFIFCNDGTWQSYEGLVWPNSASILNGPMITKFRFIIIKSCYICCSYLVIWMHFCKVIQKKSDYIFFFVVCSYSVIGKPTNCCRREEEEKNKQFGSPSFSASSLNPLPLLIFLQACVRICLKKFSPGINFCGGLQI